MNSTPDSTPVEDPTPPDVAVEASAVEVTPSEPRGATEADITIARRALLEITSAESIGEPAGSTDEGDGVVTVYFDTLLSGYPGWRWTVSLAHLEGEEPSVLETELTPGDTALLSPAWIPWVDRLADYRAAQDAAGASADDESDDDLDESTEDDDDADDDIDDPDTDDDDDDDDLGSDILHSGDVDGVDIDSVDEDSADDDAYDDGDETEFEEEDSDELEVSSSYLGIDEADDSDDESGDAAPEKPTAP